MPRTKTSEEKRTPLGVVVATLLLIAALLALLLGWWQRGAGRGADLAEPPAAAPPSAQVSPPGQPTATMPSLTDKTEPWMLALVNAKQPLDEDYQPPELQEIGDGFRFDARAAAKLLEMLDDARAQGLAPRVCSAYRSVGHQTRLFDQQLEKQLSFGWDYDQAVNQAIQVVAYPGTSEHHLGLAVDIVAQSYQVLDEAQMETAETQWLVKNCSRYGFILRYPADKAEITGISFEPWHYRYVGEEAAALIMQQGICLEEFLEQLDHD